MLCFALHTHAKGILVVLPKKRAQRSSDRTRYRYCANRVLTTSRNPKLRPVSGREVRLSIINTRSSVPSTRKNSVPNRDDLCDVVCQIVVFHKVGQIPDVQ